MQSSLASLILTAATLWPLVAASLDAQQPLGVSSTSPPVAASHSPDAPSWRDDLLTLHRSLVEIPSISYTEGRVAHFLQDYLTQRDYTVWLQPVPQRNNTPGPDEPRFNVLAWKSASPHPSASIVLSSHIDVVPPHIPYGIEPGPITRETRIKGRGSVDAKASVAAQIQALENLLASGHVGRDDVLLLFVVGEEDSGDGMRAFSGFLDAMDPRPQFDAVIFGEPTENKLACGHKGGLFCGLTARGVAGHSGYPWLGKSANGLMINALAKILNTDLGSDDLFGNTTVNVGILDGGVAANVIAENSFAKLAIRVAIGPQDDGGKIVWDRVLAILNEVDPEAFTLTCSHDYGVVKTNCDVDGFEVAVMNYGTDIPNLKGSHTRYLYGPGSILVAHGDNENLTVADLETAVEGFQKLILHALSN
ncbi:Zn-dependent exopeptidase [Sodiomyces alkalinus F11]|uniref:Zn-dependent exopeptidase n=1 Tax=Sodiomyces alkalinus (strain CBS 110278 / VKM F-3762 / F11) TaxID=1314773 RepID=A0A3N2PRD5_SODAK|nr:Zn-dependent exopeptidase [Sodiomyces alkalinus F11]ROT37055.1 Zn-dependent exopeptidase [Sodiomyces alkalinus F11]